MDIEKLYWIVDKYGEHGLQGDTVDAMLDATDRLKKYEDAEEEGRLAVLPCKVGDKVFICIPHNSTGSQVLGILPSDVVVAEMEVWGVEIRRGAIRISDGDRYSGDFGKTVFLTREEAEKALKEV